MVDFENGCYRFKFGFRDDFWIFPSQNGHLTENCIYDNAWEIHQCTYISWNTAVCTYPHLISDLTSVSHFLKTLCLKLLTRDVWLYFLLKFYCELSTTPRCHHTPMTTASTCSSGMT